MTKILEMRAKRAKLWEEGRLVRDYVPCVSNGVASLYDRVSRTFAKSQTSAAFEPGETVVAITDADVVSWSGAFSAADATSTWDGGGADNSFVTNPNAADCYIRVNDSAEAVRIPGGETVRLT